MPGFLVRGEDVIDDGFQIGVGRGDFHMALAVLELGNEGRLGIRVTGVFRRDILERRPHFLLVDGVAIRASLRRRQGSTVLGLRVLRYHHPRDESRRQPYRFHGTSSSACMTLHPTPPPRASSLRPRIVGSTSAAMVCLLSSIVNASRSAPHGRRPWGNRQRSGGRTMPIHANPAWMAFPDRPSSLRGGSFGIPPNSSARRKIL